MKVVIELDEGLDEECVVIKCKSLDERIVRLQKLIADVDKKERDILLYKNEKSYYIPSNSILFFETENKQIWAHTANEMFETEYKLYELEEVLPGYFMRISKSAIVNLNQIYSITKNVTSSSVVEFDECHKKVYVSRNYYKALIERLDEKRRLR